MVESHTSGVWYTADVSVLPVFPPSAGASGGLLLDGSEPKQEALQRGEL